MRVTIKKKKKKRIGNWVLVGKGRELEERRLRTREILDLSYMLFLVGNWCPNGYS